MSVYVFMWAYVHVCACQRSTLGVCLRHSPFYFSEIGSFTAHRAHWFRRQGREASEDHWSSCLTSAAEVTETHAWPFLWVLRSRTSALMLMPRDLLSEPSPSPWSQFYMTYELQIEGQRFKVAVHFSVWVQWHTDHHLEMWWDKSAMRWQGEGRVPAVPACWQAPGRGKDCCSPVSRRHRTFRRRVGSALHQTSYDGEFLRSVLTQQDGRKMEIIFLGFIVWFAEKTLGTLQPPPSSHFLEKKF